MRLFSLYCVFFSLLLSADAFSTDSSTVDGTKSLSCDASPCVVIIANKNIETLNSKQTYRLFTLRQKLLPSGKPVRLAIHPVASKTTMRFAKKVFDLYPYQLERIWDRQIYSGKASEPNIFDDEMRLIQFIINTPNALSYISNNSDLLSKYEGELNVIKVY